MMRSARPKLTLSVPTVTSPTVATMAPKSPFPFGASASPLSSPTVRNTLLNQKSFVSMSPLPVVSLKAAPISGCMKKPGSISNKKISFCKEASVNLISPMPADYHGTYQKMSKDEVRWATGA